MHSMSMRLIGRCCGRCISSKSMIDDWPNGAWIFDWNFLNAWNARNCNDSGNLCSLKLPCLSCRTSVLIGSLPFHETNFDGFMKYVVLKEDSLSQGNWRNDSKNLTMLKYFGVGQGTYLCGIKISSTMIINLSSIFLHQVICDSLSSLWHNSAIVISFFFPISFFLYGSLPTSLFLLETGS